MGAYRNSIRMSLLKTTTGRPFVVNFIHCLAVNLVHCSSSAVIKAVIILWLVDNLPLESEEVKQDEVASVSG